MAIFVEFKNEFCISLKEKSYFITYLSKFLYSLQKNKFCRIV